MIFCRTIVVRDKIEVLQYQYDQSKTNIFSIKQSRRPQSFFLLCLQMVQNDLKLIIRCYFSTYHHLWLRSWFVIFDLIIASIQNLFIKLALYGANHLTVTSSPSIEDDDSPHWPLYSAHPMDLGLNGFAKKSYFRFPSSHFTTEKIDLGPWLGRMSLSLGSKAGP